MNSNHLNIIVHYYLINMWNNLTNSLLHKNHIKIPIEKRFFLSFIEDDEIT